jgi:CelD/BcsL family acetyltransferase involved in cellulose biosynthesis
MFQVKNMHRNRQKSYLPGSSTPVQVTRLSTLSEARALAPEWADLAEGPGARNPFTHPGWLLPWAERFIRPREGIWLLTARQDGRLVGVAPFYRRSWGPGLAHSMQLWGTGRNGALVELPQFLTGRDRPRAVARALVTRLCAETTAWDWAEIPLEDSLWLEPDWLPPNGAVTVLTKLVRASVVLPIQEHMPLVMKKNLRESLRRSRNRLNRSYPGAWSVNCASDCASIIDALSDLARLHHDRSIVAGKERHPNMLEAKADWSFLQSAVSTMAQREAASIYRLLVYGKAIAALLVLYTKEGSYFLLSGFTQQSWEFSPITLLQGRAIADAGVRGCSWVNLSTGPDTAKLRWSEQLTLSTEFVLVPDNPLSRIAFGAFWQASAAAEVLRERRRHKSL